MMTVNLQVETPLMPNFLKVIGLNQLVDVAMLSEPEIERLGKEWTEALKLHAKSRKNQQKEGK